MISIIVVSFAAGVVPGSRRSVCVCVWGGGGG